MPNKAYKLRPEYEGTLVGGSVITGTDCGTMDIPTALAEGNGQIETDDHVLQGILENYYGMHDGAPSLIFQTLVRAPNGAYIPEELAGPARSPVHPSILQANPVSQNKSPQDPPAPPAQIGEAALTGDVGDTTPPAGERLTEDAPVEHGDSEGGYGGLTVSELQDIISERGLLSPRGATKATLVAVLEDHDNETEATS